MKNAKSKPRLFPTFVRNISDCDIKYRADIDIV